MGQRAFPPGRGRIPQPPGPRLPDYVVETHAMRIGDQDFSIRRLADTTQYSDPDGSAERAGVDPSSWALFGVVWPAGEALAEAMCVMPIAGKRILEVGCGLGLASLVLQRRGADITACDHHPLAESFMRANTDLNDLAPIAFSLEPWGGPDTGLGLFDLLIGADLLYDRGHPRLLASFVARHAKATSQFVLADAGRGHCPRFNACMLAEGYTRTEVRVPTGNGWPPGQGGKILTYDRVDSKAGALPASARN